MGRDPSTEMRTPNNCWPYIDKIGEIVWFYDETQPILFNLTYYLMLMLMKKWLFQIIVIQLRNIVDTQYIYCCVVARAPEWQLNLS